MSGGGNTRYFYSDPLAAAWMAKHHGIRFQNRNSGTEITGPDIVEHATTGNVCQINIHPESLHCLEPQIGDVVCRNDGTAELVTHVKANHPAIDGGTGTALYYDNPHIKHGAPWIDKAFVTIIQRDGLAFMWPESESEAA